MVSIEIWEGPVNNDCSVLINEAYAVEDWYIEGEMDEELVESEDVDAVGEPCFCVLIRLVPTSSNP